MTFTFDKKKSALIDDETAIVVSLGGMRNESWETAFTLRDPENPSSQPLRQHPEPGKFVFVAECIETSKQICRPDSTEVVVPDIIGYAVPDGELRRMYATLPSRYDIARSKLTEALATYLRLEGKVADPLIKFT